MAPLIAQIKGHDEVWRSLEAKVGEGRLPHALAFAGPSGIGKRLVAWALAQRLVCEADRKPCGRCPACGRVAKHQSESVLLLEPTGPQIKLEAAEKVLEFLSLARMTAARIVIIDDAQKLNPQAANRLLKIVEEPPPATHFFLLVTEISQLLPTLRSRVQVVRFRPLSSKILAEAGEAPEWMRRSARGSFERLAQFRGEEALGLRASAFAFLGAATRRERRGLDEFLRATKDRDDALEALRFLQQSLRDWSVLGQGDLIHADTQAVLADLPEVPRARRVALFRESIQMEADLLGHIDRSLVFENFFYRSGHALD